MGLRRRHFGWDRALLPSVCRALLERAEGPLADLSHIRVIVPTVQAGRRLRESLAREAGRGLLPPLVGTPEQLIGDAGADTADEASLLAAWAEVLESAASADFRHVFPRAPERDPSWKLGMALRLIRLQGILGEEGRSFAAVAASVEGTPCEPARWNELARLEDAFLQALARRGLRDPHSVRRDNARTPVLPEGIREVIVTGVADPLPLAMQALEAIARAHPVEIWTYGPEDDGAFDALGRPETAFWTARTLPLDPPATRIHCPSGPEDAARSVADAIGGKTVESVTTGLPDHALAGPVAKALADKGTASYDPEGLPLNRGGAGHLADLLCRFATEAGTPAVRELLHHPDVWQALDNGEASQAGVLALLDDLAAEHLPAGLEDLSAFAGSGPKRAPLRTALDFLRELQGVMASAATFAAGLRQALGRIYQSRTIDPSDPHGAAWIERAETLARILERAEAAENHFPEAGAAFQRAAVRQAVGRAKASIERPDDAHDLLGWLELLWTDGPGLVLAGLNEGSVPESVNGDAFLPEQLREQLGLRTNARRFARDAYLLAASCHWRIRAGGRIDLIVPKTAADGTPLKPSRLLFRCEDTALPQRARELFAEPAAPARSRQRGAFPLLRPPAAKRPDALSVSQLNAWLNCPFRFCLGQILRMQPVRSGQREMDPLLFGTVFHAVVESLAGTTFNAGTDPGELGAHLEAALDREMAARFGKRLSFALRLQRESLAARLHAFAWRQAEATADDGPCTVEAVEKRITVDIEGLELRGRIDRIDRMDTGDLRLVDYKTGDTPRTPGMTHLKPVGKSGRPDWLPDEAFVVTDGKEYHWTDLQLPLYVEALRREGAQARAAYFNLPKSREKAGFAYLELTPELLDSAVRCAGAVAREITAGHFWPPNLDLREEYDAFAPLFPDGIASAVDARDFDAFTFAAEEDPS